MVLKKTTVVELSKECDVYNHKYSVTHESVWSEILYIKLDLNCPTLETTQAPVHCTRALRTFTLAQR